MSTAIEQARPAASFILSEANGQRSRANGKAITALKAGTVVKAVAATSDVPAHYVIVTASNEGDAINIYPITAPDSGEEADSAFIVRDAEVNGNLLTYPTGANDVDKANIAAALATKGIIVRF